uniref:hypothetical protein n=1 Tax=Candidatus Wunengus sp. YC61 TaxID=3367698 RepID=UPI0040253670
MEKIKLSDVTFDTVKSAVYGCINCLWQCVECTNGSRFQPDIFQGKPTCKRYAYYD